MTSGRQRGHRTSEDTAEGWFPNPLFLLKRKVGGATVAPLLPTDCFRLHRGRIRFIPGKGAIWFVHCMGFHKPRTLGDGVTSGACFLGWLEVTRASNPPLFLPFAAGAFAPFQLSDMNPQGDV